MLDLYHRSPCSSCYRIGKVSWDGGVLLRWPRKDSLGKKLPSVLLPKNTTAVASAVRNPLRYHQPAYFSRTTFVSLHAVVFEINAPRSVGDFRAYFGPVYSKGLRDAQILLSIS